MKKTKKFIILFLLVAIVLFSMPIRPEVYSINAPGEKLTKTQISEIRSDASKESKENVKTAFTKGVFEQMGVNASFADKVNDYYKNRLYSADEICGVFKVNNTAPNTGIMLLGTGENTNSYDKMNLAIIYAKNDNVITMFGFFEWLEMPWLKSDDIIGIGTTAGSINQDEALLYVQYSTRQGQNLDATFQEGHNTEECTYIGKYTTAAFEYNLPDNITSMSAMICSEVTCSQETTITAQYFHKKFLVNLSPSISYIAGISISPERARDEYYVQCGVS